MLEPNTEADIFSASADIDVICQNYGQVSTAANSPDPSQYHATVRGVEGVREKCTALLQVMGQPCRQPVETLECELVSDITGAGTIHVA